MGYEIWWIFDCQNEVNGKLPPQINFYTYSYERLCEKMPFTIYDLWDQKKFNATPGMVMQFHKDHLKRYDNLWLVEYDACCYGEWVDFFEKFKDNDADLITTNIASYSEEENFYHWVPPRMSEEFQDMLKQKYKLTRSLNCICRISSRLLDDTYDFLKNLNSPSVFFEWVWITVAKTKGYNVIDFNSPIAYTYCPLSPDFSDYKLGQMYHAIKLDISWKDVLSKGGIIVSK